MPKVIKNVEEEITMHQSLKRVILKALHIVLWPANIILKLGLIPALFLGIPICALSFVVLVLAGELWFTVYAIGVALYTFYTVVAFLRMVATIGALDISEGYIHPYELGLFTRFFKRWKPLK